MKPPTALMITRSLVRWDVRPQKIARTIADEGWDVWLVGQSASHRREIHSLGRAQVLNLPVRRPLDGWSRRHLVEFEAFDELLDHLRPDVIHAHDADMLPVGARAKQRAQERGQAIKLIYDAHEFIAGVRGWDETWRLAMLVGESRHIGQADGVMTVTDPVAELLNDRYDLAERPTVVKNAVERDPADLDQLGPLSDVRTDCALEAETGLLAYSGTVSPHRGLSTVVFALKELEGVHLALQVAKRHGHVLALEEQAEELGVRERLHVLPYVESRRVADYLRTADVGVIPLLHTPNHEVALCNKYFEFMHALLPIVTSDVRLQAQTTSELGNGEVFRAGDVSSFVQATRAVLANRERYTGAYDAPGVLERHSWEAQRPILVQFYTRLTGCRPRSRWSKN